jgi:thioredoxin-dependent peroxiredoxin
MLFKLLPVGAPAPDFTLPDSQGTPVSLASYRGRPVVIIFYPADFTPGCTGQLCMFRDAAEQLADEGMVVLAINPGSPQSHQKFADAHQLPFPLLSDKGMTVAKAYKASLIPGLLQNRVVYGLDAQGKVCFAQVGNPDVTKVMAALKQPVN